MTTTGQAFNASKEQQAPQCSAADVSEQNYLVQVVNRESWFTARSDKSLLVGMELDASQAIAVGCRGGGCGMCKIRVLAGRYDSKRMSRAHISEQEQAEDYVLACRIYPRSDLVIESDHFTVKPEL